MNKLFSVFGLMIMATSIPTFAQNVGVGYKSDGSDVSGDFAEAEGDGASVSADVTVGFKIGKKIAIALKQPDGSFTTNPIFHPPTGFDASELEPSLFWMDNPDFTPYTSSQWNNVSKSYLRIKGAIYSNTDVSITYNPTKEFVNEDDPSSVIKARWNLNIHANADYSGSALYVGDNNDSSTSVFPYTTNLPVTAFTANGGALMIHSACQIYLDTMDATDRSGNYYASTTITVTAL